MERGGFWSHRAPDCLSSDPAVRDPEAAFWTARSGRLEKPMAGSGRSPLSAEVAHARYTGKRVNGSGGVVRKKPRTGSTNGFDSTVECRTKRRDGVTIRAACQPGWRPSATSPEG